MADKEEYLKQKQSSEALSAALHDISNPVGYVKSNISTLKKYLVNIHSSFSEYEALLLEAGLTPESMRSLKGKYDLEYILGDIDELVDESIEGLTRVEESVKRLKNTP